MFRLGTAVELPKPYPAVTLSISASFICFVLDSLAIAAPETVAASNASAKTDLRVLSQEGGPIKPASIVYALVLARCTDGRTWLKFKLARVHARLLYGRDTCPR